MSLTDLYKIRQFSSIPRVNKVMEGITPVEPNKDNRDKSCYNMKENDDLDEVIHKFVENVKLRKTVGSFNIALSSVHVFRRIIAQTEGSSAKKLLEVVKEEGKKLMLALPFDTAVGNMLRRVLRIIREEYELGISSRQEETDAQESLHRMVKVEQVVIDYSQPVPDLKSAIMDNIGEFITELETSSGNITSQALQHIHSQEIIMTIGKSQVVESFLIEAAKQRTFQVIVAECSPFYHGHKLVLNLGKAGIQTTLIADSSIFPMMARVNKVIIGTHTVMANGGLKAVCGSYLVGLAAKYYSVPVLVLASLYKFCPLYRCPDNFNQLVSPEGVLDYSTGALMSKVRVLSPVFDYVPPELVALFISNTGGHAPSYVYRLLTELYRPMDFEI